MYQLNRIGTVNLREEEYQIELDAGYIPGIKALEGFSHLIILWWCSEFDNEQCREIIEVAKPYKMAPPTMGIFATRSPMRPNPLAMTVIEVIGIDYQKGVIRTSYMDAFEGTPILDIKPYTPSSDRIETPKVPHWCAHWPASFESSEGFNWEEEFTFE